MSRKEEIIRAALELASEKGLAAVTLSQIADRVGVRKPSLYNHFSSKEQLVTEMYTFLRERARQGSAPSGSPAMPDGSLEEILLSALEGYLHFLSDPDMLCFFKVLYSERSTSPAAAQLMLDETEKMLSSTRALFYALAVHGKIKNFDVDAAADAYAMAVHSLVDRQMDMVTAGALPADSAAALSPEMRRFVAWFSKQTEVTPDE